MGARRSEPEAAERESVAVCVLRPTGAVLLVGHSNDVAGSNAKVVATLTSLPPRASASTSYGVRLARTSSLASRSAVLTSCPATPCDSRQSRQTKMRYVNTTSAKPPRFVEGVRHVPHSLLPGNLRSRASVASADFLGNGGPCASILSSSVKGIGPEGVLNPTAFLTFFISGVQHYGSCKQCSRWGSDACLADGAIMTRGGMVVSGRPLHSYALLL